MRIRLLRVHLRLQRPWVKMVQLELNLEGFARQRHAFRVTLSIVINHHTTTMS